MPGWHKKIQPLVEAGKLKVAGIVQEQHPDRAVLYMQWQKMTWPVLADPFNDLGIKVVPITLLIDESGIVRYMNPKGDDLDAFLARNYPKNKSSAKLKKLPTTIKELEPLKDARSKFRLGVAYRMRHDSKDRKTDDFSKAIASWGRALELNPDQYIWRRRIQQYGPRLDKPYSFYDWVNKARKEITARGETPHPLSAEPGGSEFAYPERNGGKAQAEMKHPDPEAKITRDKTPLIGLQAVVVPSTKGDGKAVRVHLTFRPGKDIHWSNDAGNISFFPESNGVVTIHDQQIPKLPKMPSTSEERVIEFEVRPVKGKKLPETLKGTAFYFVCQSADGVCQYLRRDIEISLKKR